MSAPSAPTVDSVDSVVPRRPGRGLRATLAVLAPPKLPLVVAVAAGAAALGSAVALTAVSAWLISRAAQHPPFVALSLAVVAVRALGISRGVFGYLERLASHDVALLGMVRLREQLYLRLAAADRGVVAGLRRGELMARVGADVDLVGDVLVRGLLPFAVAGVVCVLGVGLLTVVLPAAGAVLACCLLLAGGLAPWLAGTAASRAHRVVDGSAAELSALAKELLDHATELTVTGRVGRRLDDMARVDAVRARGLDAARPGAWAAAASTAAMGFAVVGCLLVAGAAVEAGRLAPVMLALVTLTPLAMAEVVAPLPAAAVALVRGGLAAQRLAPLLLATPEALRLPAVPQAPGPVSVPAPGPGPRPGPGPGPGPGPQSGTAAQDLRAGGLSCGWPGSGAAVAGVDLHLAPGEVLAITGPSGAGKSTLLYTLAGLLPPVTGQVWLDGVPLAGIPPLMLRRTVTLTAEDAHVFATTLRENLLVARGDAGDGELLEVLARVGLGPWVDGLRDGLATMLEPGVISGGERRRLLLARALLVGSRVMLLDEPAEHLDVAASRRLMDELTALARSDAVAVAVVTHHPDAIVRAGRVLALGS